MASTAYIFLVVISTYQIVAGNNILNVLRSIAEDAVPSYNAQERKVSPAIKPSLKQPVVIVIGDGILDQAHHQKHSRVAIPPPPPPPPYRPRSEVPRPREDISQQTDLISRVLDLLQGNQQVKHEAPVTRRPRIGYSPLYHLLKKESVHSPVLKTLLRQSNRNQCEKQNECESECPETKDNDRCKNECEEVFECPKKTRPPTTTTEYYCDPCEEDTCGEDNCPQSTKGYPLEPADTGCSRC